MSTAERTINTYHCTCTQLVLASTSPIQGLKARNADSSLILPLPKLSSTSDYASLVNTSLDTKPIVIRRQDGFEKRYRHTCGRCDLTIAYSLDQSLFDDTKSLSGPREHVVYLIPGALLSTEDMKAGKDLEQDMPS